MAGVMKVAHRRSTGNDIIYVMCLIGMYRGNLLKTPCYCLMFFNGIVDIMDLVAGSFLAAYFHFTGAVFCTSVGINWFAGYFSWCVWSGASFNCAVLALNRVVEMIPSFRSLRFLFRGKSLYIWMVLSVAYMMVLPFITRSHPFNSVISTYVSSPMITDDAAKLFIQALLICITTAITALSYVVLGFFPISRGVVIAGNVFWQMSHGLHAVIYFCFNQSIRSEVLWMCRRKKSPAIVSVSAAVEFRKR
ncbi:unnamed protein product [Haemonchus placei]|uniref:G_PROTEIN_RECEP_F1_2 domain-containing protein n=1 Tax=Haemonchus placei TaxID=6290 RepID=A0A0N4W1B9_HAEPC|nr:unnamed protein product [Haemonchus placei]